MPNKPQAYIPSFVVVFTNTIFLQRYINSITANLPTEVGGATGNFPVIGFGWAFDGLRRYGTDEDEGGVDDDGGEAEACLLVLCDIFFNPKIQNTCVTLFRLHRKGEICELDELIFLKSNCTKSHHDSRVYNGKYFYIKNVISNLCKKFDPNLARSGCIRISIGLISSRSQQACTVLILFGFPSTS